MDCRSLGISNYDDFIHIFKRTVSIKLDRIDTSEYKNKGHHCSPRNQNLRVTRSRTCNKSSIDWVRMLKGWYKGDIGRLKSINKQNGDAEVMLLPRINYDSLDAVDFDEKPPKRRPPYKPFDPVAYK